MTSRTLRICVGGLLLPLSLLVPVAMVSCKDSSSRQPPQVVVYCSADQEIAEPILKQFERQSGIKVLARFDTEAGKTVGLVHCMRFA